MPKVEVQVVSSLVPGWGMVRHVKVKRIDGRSGISWDLLQDIKNEYLGEDSVAVEIYPSEDDVVYEENIRHLWEVPFGVSIPNLSRRSRRY